MNEEIQKAIEKSTSAIPPNTMKADIRMMYGWAMDVGEQLERFCMGGWTIVPGTCHVFVLERPYGLPGKTELQQYIVLQMWRTSQ